MIFTKSIEKQGSKLQRRLDVEIDQTDKRALDERSFAEACGYPKTPKASESSKLFVKGTASDKPSDHAAQNAR